ncbi:MAG: hypothetical protein IJE25_08995 [Clostridia bacterium]|nr:hypothetical protein [Clostridia bacterium]
MFNWLFKALNSYVIDTPTSDFTGNAATTEIESSPLISDPASFVIGLLIGIAATALCFTIGIIIAKNSKKNNKK